MGRGKQVVQTRQSQEWIHLGSKEAGPRVAAIFSIVETCLPHGRLVGVYENGNHLPIIPPPTHRSASSASQNLPRDPALFVPPKAVARALHFSHSPKSAALRWLGQEGLLGAERFALTDRRSLPRG
jgi:hypothetical protein